MRFFASLKVPRAVTIIGTLLIAFFCGHLMQNVLANSSDVATTGTAPNAAPILEDEETLPELPVPPAATLLPIRLEQPVRRVGGEPSKLSFELPLDEATGRQINDPCSAVATAEPRTAGRFLLTLDAPCSVGKVVRVEQADLTLSFRLSTEGTLAAELPAFEHFAEIAVFWPNEGQTKLSVEVPGATDLYRAVLAFDAAPLLGLHALEFGAVSGERGHVHAGSPKTPDRAARGAGGYLMSLGDGSGAVAEVYTFPRNDAQARGVVRILAQGEVSEETCGRQISARALQSDPLGGLLASTVSVTMPPCDTIGQIVELKNLFRDLRLARR